jgi:hypothetical protein
MELSKVNMMVSLFLLSCWLVIDLQYITYLIWLESYTEYPDTVNIFELLLSEMQSRKKRKGISVENKQKNWIFFIELKKYKH